MQSVYSTFLLKKVSKSVDFSHPRYAKLVEPERFARICLGVVCRCMPPSASSQPQHPSTCTWCHQIGKIVQIRLYIAQLDR